MKKLRNFFAFFILSSITFLVNQVPVMSQEECDCFSYDCYWDPLANRCMVIDGATICGVVCDE